MTMMMMESNPNGHWLWDQMGSCLTWNGVYSIGKKWTMGVLLDSDN